jgi:hypothetical protein
MACPPCHRLLDLVNPFCAGSKTVHGNLRREMRYQLVAGLCFAFILALFAGSNGYNVKYGGGSLPDTQAGTDLKMYIGSNQVRFVKDQTQLVTIPASRITEISSKKDSVGMTWADGDQKGGLAVQCDKNDCRGVLARLEGMTGKKVVNSVSMTVEN